MLSGKDVLIWGNKMIIKMFNVHKQEHQPGIANILQLTPDNSNTC